MHLCGLSSIPRRHSRDELRISCRHLQKSCLVYEFTSDCASTYVGRTSQSLAERISHDQHLPDRLFERATRSRKSTADSAITTHMREHPECINTDPKSRFKVLASARDFWHLEVLEALFIKARNPSLCAQKEHVCFEIILSFVTFWSNKSPVVHFLAHICHVLAAFTLFCHHFFVI